jgi:hypothetical protein
MTYEEYQQKQIDLINHHSDLNAEITTIWSFHPENPDRIDPVVYHAILVEKISKLEDKINELREQYESI